MPKKSLNRDITFNFERVQNKPQGETHLFLIGINNYEHCPRLRNCINDIDRFKALMLTQYGFKEELIEELRNEEATQENIFNSFKTLLGKVKPADNLLIYFSGHGSYEALYEEGFWIPVEAKIGAVHQYIPNSTIQKMLNAFKAQHIFLIADSCFSGSLFATYRSMEVADRLERHPSRWGLTSGRNEVVADGIGENSPFSESLLFQLTNADGPIGVSELCNRVIESVIANENQTPQGEPLRVKGHQGGQFFFHPKGKEQLIEVKTNITPVTKRAIPTKKEILPADIQLPIITLLYDKEDKALVARLKNHLSILSINKQAYLFEATKFKDSEVALSDWFTHSKVILCLLSPSFMANCYGLAEQVKSLNKTIIPVYLKNVPYENTFLGQLRGLPQNRQFIADFPNQDVAFKEIVTIISNFLS